MKLKIFYKILCDKIFQMTYLYWRISSFSDVTRTLISPIFGWNSTVINIFSDENFDLASGTKFSDEIFELDFSDATQFHYVIVNFSDIISGLSHNDPNILMKFWFYLKEICHSNEALNFLI